LRLEEFQAGDSIEIPPEMRYATVESSPDLKFLEVALTGDLEIASALE